MRGKARSIPVPGFKNIGIREEAKKAVDALAAETGMSQIEIMTRVYLWFVALPSELKKSILWPATTNAEREAVRLMLRLMDSESRQPGAASASLEQAAQAELPPPPDENAAERDTKRRRRPQGPASA